MADKKPDSKPEAKEFGHETEDHENYNYTPDDFPDKDITGNELDPLTGVKNSKYKYSDMENPPTDPAPYEFDILEKLGVPGTPEERKGYHETIRSSKDTLEKLGKAGPDRFLKGASARRGKKSIVGMAAKNTFEFPVFVSKSIPLDYATAINSLLEQIYASYLQMAVTLNPIIDKKTAMTGGPFSSFKTNITKYVEYTDMFYAHDAAHAYYDTGDYTVEFDMISITDADAKVINEAVEYQPLSEFSHFFQEANNNQDGLSTEIPKHDDEYYPTPRDDHGYERPLSISEKVGIDHEIEEGRKKIEKLTQEVLSMKQEYEAKQKELEDPDIQEAKKLKLTRECDKLLKDIENSRISYEKQLEELHKMREESTVNKNYLKTYGVERLGRLEEILNKRKKLIFDTRKSGLEVAKLLDEIDRDEERWKMEREKHAKDMMTRGPQFMDETKIQKLNTMKPLMMTVQLKVVDTKGGISAPVEYVVGVKTHCRLVDPDILPDVVKYPLKKMDRLTRRAKWRAGEIKFFDYIFNIKEKKQTAVDAKDPKRKWYRRLYELAHKKGDAHVAARISGNNSSGLIPNATIIMSQTDVDNIKSMTDINLLKGSSGRALCNELFLMALIIVDMDSESIKILLPDINNDYEIHSLASVKKQLATLDTAGDKARDMFKLLGR